MVHRLRRHHYILGEGTIDVDAGLQNIVAQGLEARAAGQAVTAVNDQSGGNPVAHFKAGDAGADGGDIPGELVPRDERDRHSPHAFDNRDVRTADTHRLDFD